VRGDVFWGRGSEAEAVAGHMKHDGRLWLLLPSAVAQGLLLEAKKGTHNVSYLPE